MAGNTSHSTDHRRNAEELLAQLAQLMHPGNSRADEVRLAQRRRAAARHLITTRVMAERIGRVAVVA